MATDISLETFNDRVWFAWNCLPRVDRGKPPSWKKLEAEFGISGATFSKLVSGERSSVGSDQLVKIARALKVTTDWLVSGTGDPPTPSGPVRSREKRFDQYDPSTFAEKYQAIGGVVIEAPNPFQVAALYHGAEIDKDIIEAVAIEARGREDTRTALGWGRDLVERQRRRNAEKAKKKRRPTKPPEPPAMKGRRAS